HSAEMFALLLYCFACCCSLSSFAFPIQDERNDRPIIVLLAQELRSPSPGRSSYIAASYVKTESAGARVAPVMVNQTEEQYRALFNSINGILFPGGGVDLVTSLYARSAKIFYDLAIEANDRGDYFPVWGTCLGFEELTYLTGELALVTQNDMRDAALPLNCYRSVEAKESKMFRDLPAELRKALASESLTANSHKWSLATSSYDAHAALKKFYKVLSTNSDGDLEFVSTIEAARDYPIYGTQWHPEKNAYEFTKAYVPHSPSAVRTSFYAAEFFVGEARKNRHGFGSEAEERKALIYNYSPEYGRPNGTFVQIYYF
uniref:folate gamma-glutamyl hydrolase n=1 Tax=Tetraodon nigroviridis TaxID=99883 RepID=H3D7X7_TETNG